MALPVIDIDNFIGWVKIIANQFKEEDLDQYIIIFREQYLRTLVGDIAYADIESQTRQKWDDLLNGTAYIDAQGDRRYHQGLVESLVYFIYFEFVRDNFTATQVGRVKGKSENSERANDLEILNVSRSRFNKGTSLIKDTLCFLEANKLFSEEITASADNNDNTYTLGVGNTTYIENGDLLSIGEGAHLVLSKVPDVSITIDTDQVGLDFIGAFATWQPFRDVYFCPLEPCGL